MEPSNVISDPIQMGKKCEGFGVDAVCLALVSTDPARRMPCGWSGSIGEADVRRTKKP